MPVFEHPKARRIEPIPDTIVQVRRATAHTLPQGFDTSRMRRAIRDLPASHRARAVAQKLNPKRKLNRSRVMLTEHDE